MDNALDFESKDCGFESHQRRFFIFFAIVFFAYFNGVSAFERTQI